MYNNYMVSRDVDLTIDSKFGQARSVLDESWRARSRIKTPTGGYTLGLKRSSLLPWNCKKLDGEVGLTDYIRKRYHQKEDFISEEYGHCIRMTYNNRLWVMKPDKQEWHKEAFEEFLMETTGGYPYIPINTCFRCGKISISPYKETWRYHICNKCGKGRIPWR